MPVRPPADWTKRTESPLTSGLRCRSGSGTAGTVTPAGPSLIVVEPIRPPPEYP